MIDKPENKPLAKRLLSAMLNFGLANVMTKIIGFLLIPLYTQYLTPEDYGIVEICASLSAFAIVLMRLGVPGSVLRFYFDYKDDEAALNDYVATVHRLLIVSSIAVGLIMAVLSFIFSSSLLSGVLFVPFILLVLINAGFSANSDLQKRLLQSKEESAYVAKLNIATAALSIGITILLVVVYELGALGIIISQSIVTFIFFIQAQFYLRRYLKGKFKFGLLKSSLRYGVALLPHHLFVALAPFLAKGILNYKESLAALGIYSLALRFTQPLDILYGIFNKAFVPIYFSLRKEEENKKIKNIYTSVWYLAVLIFALAVLVLPTLIIFLTPERFHESSKLVPILAVSFIAQIVYMFFLLERYYDKKTKFVSVVTGLGLFVNLSFTLLTVNEFGIYSITIAYALGFVTWAIVAYFFSGKYFLNHINIETIFMGVVLVAIALLVAIYSPNDAYIIRASVLCIMILVVGALNFQKFKKAILALRR